MADQGRGSTNLKDEDQEMGGQAGGMGKDEQTNMDIGSEGKEEGWHSNPQGQTDLGEEEEAA